jgi:hypothetical protein
MTLGFIFFLIVVINSISSVAKSSATPLCVCKNIRIPRHKTFKDEARRGKSSTGWFYGFKLHLVVDDQGKILSFSITKGNVDDRKPVPTLAKKILLKLQGSRAVTENQ